MISINILGKGDEVLSINEKFLAVKRKAGKVDIYRVLFNGKEELSIDPVKIAEIGFGTGLVEKIIDDGETKIVTF